VTARIGQRNPQLRSVQNGGVGRRDLRVLDSRARGHQVQLAWPHHRVRTGAVTVFDLAGEQPTHSLQPGVRMRRHIHTLGARDGVGTVMVNKTPRPDEAAGALWQCTTHLHGTRSTERHIARRKQLEARGALAVDEKFGRLRLEIAHGRMVILTRAAGAGPVGAGSCLARCCSHAHGEQGP
jgi:hypothetical protein